MPLILSLSLFSSCSWIKKRRSFFWEDPKKSILEEDPSKVSRAQYAKLMKKYETLLKRHRENQWFGKKPGEHGRKSEKIVNQRRMHVLEHARLGLEKIHRVSKQIQPKINENIRTDRKEMFKGKAYERAR